MGELANAPHGSADKALASYALNVSAWRLDDARELGDPAGALVALDRMAVPAKQVEPGGQVNGARGPRTDRLIKAVQMIGAKIAPTMDGEQADAWVTAVVIALSDLPFAFAQRGAEAAIHVPMKFLNEVETAIREKAKDAEARHKLAKMRLERLRREVENAGKPALEPPKPMTPEEYQVELNATQRPILDTLLKAQAITQEQFNTAIAAQGKDETHEPETQAARGSAPDGEAGLPDTGLVGDGG